MIEDVEMKCCASVGARSPGRARVIEGEGKCGKMPKNAGECSEYAGECGRLREVEGE